jgi:hypothetical protein
MRAPEQSEVEIEAWFDGSMDSDWMGIVSANEK